MQLLPNDILVRNYKDGETLWVSQRLVLQVCQVTEEYLRTRARVLFKKSIQKGYKYGDFLPNTGSAWRWGKVNGVFYYDFDCLPDRKPTYYRSKFGVKNDLLQAYNNLLSEENNKVVDVFKNTINNQVAVLVDNADLKYFMYEAVVGFNQEQAEQMAIAKAWCLYLNKQLISDNFKKLGITKKQDFLQLCTDIIAPMQLEGFKINSAAYLRNKINDFPYDASNVEQRNYFVSGKYGNDNALVVGKYKIVDESTGEIFEFDIHQAMMFHLYMNPGSSTKEYIRTLWERDYINSIKEFDLQPVSYRTFCHHLTRFNKQIVLARARHGEEYYKKHVQTYVPSEKLQYAHSLLAGDGSGTINYRYQFFQLKKEKRNGAQ